MLTTFAKNQSIFRIFRLFSIIIRTKGRYPPPLLQTCLQKVAVFTTPSSSMNMSLYLGLSGGSQAEIRQYIESKVKYQLIYLITLLLKAQHTN